MPKQFEPTNLHASRRGNGIQKWVNEKSPTGVDQALTDATMSYDIPDGHQVHITHMSLSLAVDSDVSTPPTYFKMVSCDAAGGGGTPTDLCGEIQLSPSESDSGRVSREWIFDPPVRVTRTSGALSVTMSVNGGTATGTFNGTWQGWAEKEI